MVRQKQLTLVKGELQLPGFKPVVVTGYEIHAGVTQGAALNQPLIALDNGEVDGVISEDGQIFGTYLHAIFEAPATLNALLKWAGLNEEEAIDYRQLREEGINRMADAVEQYLDLEKLYELCGLSMM